MAAIRRLSWILCMLVFIVSMFAEFVAPAPYEKQFRELPNSPPTEAFILGTDELGRDRFSRLLYGSRVSLVLAPAAALISTLLAALVGGVAGYCGGMLERLAVRITDLFLSLPWLFLLLTLRALLPLNVSPWTSVTVTFALLGILGWPGPARVVRTQAGSLRNSEFVLQARASGQGGLRLIVMHLLPNLKPILMAQFLISVPVFILAEANLGLLGLGVSEPLPSWGNLLRDLESYSVVSAHPWLLAPLILLVATVACLQIGLGGKESSL